MTRQRSRAFEIGANLGATLGFLYIIVSIASIPVVLIAWVWGMDGRWVATLLINAVVAIIIGSAVAT